MLTNKNGYTRCSGIVSSPMVGFELEAREVKDTELGMFILILIFPEIRLSFQS